MVKTVVPINTNDDLIVIFIENFNNICEIIVFNTIKKTVLQKIKINGTFKNPNFCMSIHNTKIVHIDTLPYKIKNYSLDNTQARISKPYINLYTKKIEVGSKTNFVSLKILEYYLDQSKKILFAICSILNSKLLIIHNLATNSNTFHSISPAITSLSLSVSNYIIFNSQNFFVFWNLNTAEIDSVHSIGKFSINGKVNMTIEFNLRKYHDDWAVYKKKFLVHSVKNFTKIGVFRIIKQETEIFDKSECAPLCLAENMIIGVYKGNVRVLRSTGVKENFIELSEKMQKCLFSATFDGVNLLFGYRDRSFFTNILENEVCGEINHELLEKVIAVQSLRNIGLIVIHELTKVLIFNLKSRINLHTVNYKFKKNRFNIRITENKLNLLLINKKVMIILNLETGQQEEISYNSSRFFVDNIILINSTFFALFEKTDNFVYTQINEQDDEITLNTNKYKVLIGSILNIKQKTTFYFKDIPKIEVIKQEFLVLFETNSSFIVRLSENFPYIVPNFELLSYIKQKKLPGSDFWDILLNVMETNERTKDFKNELNILALPESGEKIVLISNKSKLYFINVENLSINIFKLYALQKGFQKIIYSSLTNSILVLYEKSIKTISLSNLTEENLISGERNQIKSHFSCTDYTVVTVNIEELFYEHLIISHTTHSLVKNNSNLEISDIILFSLPDSFLFIRKNLQEAIKTFSIPKEHQPLPAPKTFFEYFFVFFNSTSQLNKKQEIDLKVFLDQNKEFMILIYDSKVHIINTVQLELLISLGNGITKEITCVEFSQSGKFIAIGNDEGTVFYWDCHLRNIKSYFCHLNPIIFIRFHPSDLSILTYAQDEERVLISSIK